MNSRPKGLKIREGYYRGGGYKKLGIVNDLVAFSTHPWPCGRHHKDVVLFGESQPRGWGSETDANVLGRSACTDPSRKLFCVYVDWTAVNRSMQAG